MINNDKKFKKIVIKYWDKRAKGYNNEPFHYITKDERNLLRDILLKNSNGNSLLDIGTGTGLCLKIFEEDFEKTFGIDISKEMLKIAKNSCGKSSFVLCDAEKLPFKNSSIDNIICRHVFWTIKNKEKALIEWKRVLKNNGKLLIIDRFNYGFLQKFLEELIYIIINFKFKRKIFDYIKRKIFMKKYKKYLEENSFKEVLSMIKSKGFNVRVINMCKMFEFKLKNKFVTNILGKDYFMLICEVIK